jgi:diacylglycerol kinase (ATP)
MKKFSIRKRLQSFKFAIKGISLLFKNEHNSWIHLFLALSATVLGLYFDLSKMEWVAIVLAIGIVLAAEAFNTALEQMANFVQPNEDKKIEHIKDLAAGAVLLTAMSAFVTGLIIFLPKIIPLISQ